MKEIIQAIVVFILAVPFIYMAFDIAKDVVKESGNIFKGYSKPLTSGIINIFSK